ncbi:MAG: OsmC family protein, partial [Bacteroidetes bacterium]|nr:OsmC family protein [Bacteroidota bacterium]
NKGTGTSSYTEYERSHTISSKNKVDILCSSYTAFRGDATKYNPEEFLLASISTCHMLWFLHLCADAGICVIDYIDNPIGIMIEDENGGHFKSVTLHPIVTVNNNIDTEKVNTIHHTAHQKCFIANSVNFKIEVKGKVIITA